MIPRIALVSLLSTSMLCVAQAQMEFTQYVGSIQTGNAPSALAGDSEGRLYYGTFNHPDSQFCHVSVIEDPLTAMTTTDESGTTIIQMTGPGKINASGRGVQSMTIASDNTLFISGDNSSASYNNVWKFDYTPGSPPAFTEDATFTANVKAENPARRSGVSIVSEAGNGLVITCGFGTTSFVDYFDFDGHVVGSRIIDNDRYYRTIQFMAPHNVAYPFRNGSFSPAIVSAYMSGINPATGGGTLVEAPIIPDHGIPNSTGNSVQGSYYYAAQDQIISIDGYSTEDLNPSVRVYDVLDNGTSVSLAYEITGTSPETPFSRLTDATVIGNHLYVSGYDQAASYATSKVYVFTVPENSVRDWTSY